MMLAYLISKATCPIGGAEVLEMMKRKKERGGKERKEVKKGNMNHEKSPVL